MLFPTFQIPSDAARLQLGDEKMDVPIAVCHRRQVQISPRRNMLVDLRSRNLLPSAMNAVAVPLTVGAPSSGLKQHNRHGCSSTPRLAARRSRRFQVNAALPVVSSVPIVGPVANLVLSPTVLLAAYCFGAVRLWQGFERTSYSSSMSTKMGLTLLWPALFAASKKFRENFKKAAL